jgi:hypothetical protein
MTGFTEAMVPEIVQPFWAAMQRGEFITDAAGMAGTYRKKGARPPGSPAVTAWTCSVADTRPVKISNVGGYPYAPGHE